eukprot:365469-Chlamydomonas_euryale.AAC.31
MTVHLEWLSRSRPAEVGGPSAAHTSHYYFSTHSRDPVGRCQNPSSALEQSQLQPTCVVMGHAASRPEDAGSWESYTEQTTIG